MQALVYTDQQQLLDVFKLGDGEVRRQRRLTALFPDDADSDAGGLNHRNVVSTVAC